MPLHDVSVAGLSFETNVFLKKGMRIKIRMPLLKPPFETLGEVAWCREQHSRFNVGIAFTETKEALKFRIVEQVCYIEHYKHKVRESEGRRLSTEEAAREWIERYSKEFPGA